jgi:hypothetical protein
MKLKNRQHMFKLLKKLFIIVCSQGDGSHSADDPMPDLAVNLDTDDDLGGGGDVGGGGDRGAIAEIGEAGPSNANANAKKKKKAGSSSKEDYPRTGKTVDPKAGATAAAACIVERELALLDSVSIL